MTNLNDRISSILDRAGASGVRQDVEALFSRMRSLPELPRASAAVSEFAGRYTAAWCNQKAIHVAACYAKNGSLTVNYGPPAGGRQGVTDAAQGFMTAFPDMKVLMDDCLALEDRAVYCWTLIGTNTGPGGTGHKVRISGFEVWRLGADGLIVESLGHFDQQKYDRQLAAGVEQQGS